MNSENNQHVNIYQVKGHASDLFLTLIGEQITRTDESALQIRFFDGSEWQDFASGEARSLSELRGGRIKIQVDAAGKHTATFQFTGPTIESRQTLTVDCYSFDLKLVTDRNRDGVIDSKDEEGECNAWSWGKNGYGAILLVNCIESRQDYLVTTEAREARERLLSPLRIQPTGVTAVPPEVALVLYATPNAAKRFTVYRKLPGGQREIVLGGNPVLLDFPPRTMSAPLSLTGEDLWIEALEYPHSGFEGLITLELRLVVHTTEVRKKPGTVVAPIPNTAPVLHQESPISIVDSMRRIEVVGATSAFFRVAPWIMTPNTQPAKTVYICLFDHVRGAEDSPIDTIEKICKEQGIDLRVLNREESGGSPFIQDLIEFGFSAGPTASLDVICASTIRLLLRNLELLGKRFGHVRMDGTADSTLDSFGNLEVSPPVTVGKKEYPFGRILFGGHVYGDFEPARRMLTDTRHFLYAQKVQKPIELYTDWLGVGHVDEILSFVPANTKKKFRLLLASPNTAWEILRELKQEGLGHLPIFEGKTRCGRPRDAEISVEDLLARTDFWDENARFQRNMDINRRILMQELELAEEDIVDIPLLFSGESPCPRPFSSPTDGRCSAFFPNLVNHLVLGDVSIMPRPYGPKRRNEDANCVFETAVQQRLPDRKIVFIDDWFSYFVHFGDVHCATNVHREPFYPARWWQHQPEEAFDV